MRGIKILLKAILENTPDADSPRVPEILDTKLWILG